MPLLVDPGVVPLLAEGWSHAAGGTHLKVVPCRWRATRVTCVYVRFYKAFNFDYLRKAHRDAHADPWELTEDGLWYPYVRIPIERSVTPVVGANESGKSQLLAAIARALTGEGIVRSDYCRYSPFFAVDKEMARPDFGCRLEASGDDEARAAAAACGRRDASVREIVVIRQGNGTTRVFVPSTAGEDAWEEVPAADLRAIELLVPRPVVINRDTPIPASVPLSILKDGVISADGEELPRRSRFRSIVTAFSGNLFDWFAGETNVTTHARPIAAAFEGAVASQGDTDLAAQYRLADDLLVKVAGVDRTAFAELDSALADEREGFANSVVDQINARLAERLNLQRWWTQDSEFELRVTPREFDLAFTVRDRTKIEYSVARRTNDTPVVLAW